ncbi:MAG: PRC-barrel domain-containing protein [Halomonas sp.]|jgi:sporulation protein YlmC with PRC-barrel domain|uniref:PRC-barrel domain containing protein n=1 Tax=Billgrantia tianxiuensis TaxID=2497861 RepID=A0A6I6SPZ4_9GAMM|nr:MULTISPECIES: PRC-barrel domain-containing protein [Halomonas]MCE8033748.1 PRC-barrel domain-containing protein [Halomonas sp. MCCC 1A11057]MDX5434826.1 PRC-barrel domain-containing protein [Halomonas sp.]QHC51321.1 PRC-barrel domain containing protein [Halomonas tianxiuensis]
MKRTLLAIMIGAISTGIAGGALAQDNGEEENGLNGDAAVGEEQSTMGDTGAEPMDEGAEPMDEGTEPTDEGAMGTDDAGGADAMATGSQLDDSLRDMQVSEIEGMTVVNLEDEEIGDVQSVVRDNDTGDLHVVVTVGGLWGMGGTDITLPLAEMQLQDDQLVIQESYGEEELEESAEEYDEERYSELDDDEMTLGDAWGQ